MNNVTGTDYEQILLQKNTIVWWHSVSGNISSCSYVLVLFFMSVQSTKRDEMLRKKKERKKKKKRNTTLFLTRFLLRGMCQKEFFPALTVVLHAEHGESPSARHAGSLCRSCIFLPQRSAYNIMDATEKQMLNNYFVTL